MNITALTFSELGELLDQETPEELVWSDAEKVEGGYLYKYETDTSYGQEFFTDKEVEEFYKNNKNWVDEELEEHDFCTTPQIISAILMGDAKI